MIDVRVLSEILGSSGAGVGHYYLLVGRGRVLAALPREPGAFHRTLSLYRPQKLHARIWVAYLRFLELVRAPYLALPSWNWTNALNHTFPAPGILLGNPDHPVTRSVFVMKEGNQWVVGKFFPSIRVPKELEREKALLRAAATLGAHAPVFLSLDPLQKGWILRMEFVDATRVRPSLSEQVSLLRAWLLPLPFRSFSEFPLAKSFPTETFRRFSDLSSLPLRPCLRHGDFAPWNVLQTKNKGFKAVDWESGHPEDAPGFDLLHSLIQEEFLVRRSSFLNAKRRILHRLQSAPVADYLKACGWGQSVNILWELSLLLEMSKRHEIVGWIPHVSD